MKGAFILRQAVTAAALVAAAAGLGLGANALRSEPLPLVQDWEATLARRAEERLPGGVVSLDRAQMARLYRRGDVLVLDARPHDFFLMEHIPGAKSCPVEKADQVLPGLLKGLPESTRIITYCDGGACEASLKLAQKILQAGRGNVAVYTGGMLEWLEAGLPVSRGED